MRYFLCRTLLYPSRTSVRPFRRNSSFAILILSPSRPGECPTLIHFLCFGDVLRIIASSPAMSERPTVNATDILSLILADRDTVESRIQRACNMIKRVEVYNQSAYSVDITVRSARRATT